MEREEVTGEDLVVDLLLDLLVDILLDILLDILVVDMDVAEVGTGDSEGGGVEEVERREAGVGREVSKPGVRDEEPGEEGDVVAGFPGRPSSSTAWSRLRSSPWRCLFRI